MNSNLILSMICNSFRKSSGHKGIISVFTVLIINTAAYSQISHKLYINSGSTWSLDISTVENTVAGIGPYTIDQNNINLDPLQTTGPSAGVEYVLTFKEQWRWESGISYRGINGSHYMQHDTSMYSYSSNSSSWAMRMGISYDLIKPSNPWSVGFGIGGTLQGAKINHLLEMEIITKDSYESQLNEARLSGGFSLGFYTQFYAERKIFEKWIIGFVVRGEYIRHTPNYGYFSSAIDLGLGSTQLVMFGQNSTSIELSNVFMGFRMGYEL